METPNFFLIFFTIRVIEGAQPGTFFWKPRLGIDLSVSTTEASDHEIEGIIVVINAYDMGITILALGSSLAEGGTYAHLDPSRAAFYNNVYRWTLRHISLIPPWLGGVSTYADTHKTWKKRYHHLNRFVPKWLRYLFPHVSQEDWDNEEKQYKIFQEHGLSEFLWHNKFPLKYNYDLEGLDRIMQFESSESDGTLD